MQPIFWKPFPPETALEPRKGYMVSSSGRIYSKRALRPLKGHIHGTYRRIRVEDKTYQWHRLVALLFLPNPNGFRIVNHIDGNPLNNSVENLEWCTHAENTRHAIEFGLCGSPCRKWRNNREVVDISAAVEHPERPRYYIFRDGRIYSTARNIFLKPRRNKGGYPSVSIGRKTYTVHRLVAVAFLPNPMKYRVVNHIDGNKLNSAVENLEWCTHTANTRHAVDTGLIPTTKRAVIQYTPNLEKLAEFPTVKAAAEAVGIAYQQISQACRARDGYNMPAGYCWSYATDPYTKPRFDGGRMVCNNKHILLPD